MSKSKTGKKAPEEKKKESLFFSSLPYYTKGHLPQSGIIQRKNDEAKPGLSDEDKKKYKYKTVKGDLYVDEAGNTVGVDDTTGKGIKLNDVEQGYLGDCYFIAAIGALVNSDPKAIKKMIKDNKDGTYDVTLHVHNHFFSTERSPHVETVNSDFPLDNSSDPAYAQFGDKKEIWVMLIEKAYAQYYGSYENIEGSVKELRDERGNPGKGMEVLTGKKSVTLSLSSLNEEAIISKMKDALSKKIPITVSSEKFDDNKKKKKNSKAAGVIGGHAYVVKSVDETAKTINLYNPWGSSHLPALPVSDLKKYFYRMQMVK